MAFRDTIKKSMVMTYSKGAINRTCTLVDYQMMEYHSLHLLKWGGCLRSMLGAHQVAALGITRYALNYPVSKRRSFETPTIGEIGDYQKLVSGFDEIVVGDPVII